MLVKQMFAPHQHTLVGTYAKYKPTGEEVEITYVSGSRVGIKFLDDKYKQTEITNIEVAQ